MYNGTNLRDMGIPSELQQNVLKIKNVDQIERLNELIHDEYFDLSDVKYYPEENCVKIPYRRIFHNGPFRLLRNWFFLKTIEVDVIRSIMYIYNAEKFEINNADQICDYSFNYISYDENSSTLVFLCNEDPELRIKISQLHIESKDLEFRGKSRITRSVLGEASSSKVYK